MLTFSIISSKGYNAISLTSELNAIAPPAKIKLTKNVLKILIYAFLFSISLPSKIISTFETPSSSLGLPYVWISPTLNLSFSFNQEGLSYW